MKNIKHDKYKNVPEEMKNLSRWVKWKKEAKRDRQGNIKFSKIPYGIKNNSSFNWNKSCNWEEYDAAKNYIDGYDGLGYVLVKEDNIVAIDLDNCIENNKLNNFAKRIVELFNGTYMEVSQSGKGIHIFLKGSISKNLNLQNLGIELYKEDRYIALTGDIGANKYFNSSSILLNKSKEIKKLYEYCINEDEKRFKKKYEIDTESNRSRCVPSKSDSPVAISNMNKVPDINTILDTMNKTNSLASSLIDGSSYTGDPSRDDFTFLLLARNYTHKDPDLMKELFLMTSLNRIGRREKRRDDRKYFEYLDNTINKVLSFDDYKPFDWTLHNEYIQRVNKYEKY